jgi:2-keto-4-pentenoate hydratase/2-oxohepta-3-ene-1,7-dioic acid hydratase in catechol pathway
VGAFVPLPENGDTGNITFRLDKNGETVQNGNTADLIFSIDKIIAYASQYFTFNIGDLLFTGTPAGVGPVITNDKLECYLLGDKVLDVDIR